MMRLSRRLALQANAQLQFGGQHKSEINIIKVHFKQRNL